MFSLQFVNRRHEMNMDRPLLLHQSFAQKWNVAETDVAWFLAEAGWSGGKMIVNYADSANEFSGVVRCSSRQRLFFIPSDQL